MTQRRCHGHGPSKTKMRATARVQVSINQRTGTCAGQLNEREQQGKARPTMMCAGRMAMAVMAVMTVKRATATAMRATATRARARAVSAHAVTRAGHNADEGANPLLLLHPTALHAHSPRHLPILPCRTLHRPTPSVIFILFYYYHYYYYYFTISGLYLRVTRHRYGYGLGKGTKIQTREETRTCGTGTGFHG
jgi:hypothetical protein